MADLSRTIEIIFESVDHMGSGLKAIGTSIGDFAGSVEQATQPLADLTKGILATDVAVTALAITLAAKAVQENAKFEDSLYLVKKQLDAQGPSIEEARAKIEALALQYGENANDVGQSMAGFLAAGKGYEESAQLVEIATRLMIAGDLDAATATEAINKSLAGFKVPAGESAQAATRVGDALNKIGDISSGKFEEIVQGFTRLAPTAKDAGLSIEEAAAMTAVLVDKFGSGEIAATALKSGFLTLLDPSKDAKDALDALGIATTDNNGQLRSAKEIMTDLAGKYGTLTESQKLQTAAVVFGKEQAGAMNALIGDWSKSQDYLAQMMDKTTGATGSMTREVEGKLALLSTAVDRSNEAWRQFLENLGKEITAGGELQGLIDSLGKLGTALRDSVKAGDLDGLLAPFKAAFAELGDLVDQVAKNLPAALEQIDWSKLQASMGGLGDALSGIFDGIDLTTPEGLADAIQTLVDLGTGFINVTAGIVEGLDPLFTVIGTVIDGFTSLSPEVQTAAGYILGMSTAVNALSGIVGTFTPALTAAGSVLSTFGTTAGTAAAALGQAGLVGAAGAAGYAVGTVLNDGINAAVGALTDGHQTLGTWIYDLTHADETAKLTADSTAALAGAADKLPQPLGDSAKSARDFDAEIKAVEASQGNMLLSTGEIVKAYNDLAGSSGLPKAADALNKYGENVIICTDKTTLLNTATGEIVGKIDSAGNIVKDVGAKFFEYGEDQKKAAEKTKDAAKATAEFMLGWEKIQSAERIAVFEATAKIDIAKIEGDTKRTVAAFDSLSASFEGTGKTLATLFDLWGKAESFGDQSKIGDWIAKEYEIRTGLSAAQIKLTEAEIKRIEAQAALIADGGMEIKITSDGLEPELEAFMFRVIDKVRTQVAGSYQQFLLGTS